jgi:hypothetical protein
MPDRPGERCDRAGSRACGGAVTGGRTLGAADPQETPVDTSLTALHEHYARQVDAAVARDRMDLVQELYEQYFEEALRRLLETTAAA